MVDMFHVPSFSPIFKEILGCANFHITSCESGFYFLLLIFALDFSFVLDEWLCLKDGIYYILYRKAVAKYDKWVMNLSAHD